MQCCYGFADTLKAALFVGSRFALALEFQVELLVIDFVVKTVSGEDDC